jgi:hypothetical protein
MCSSAQPSVLHMRRGVFADFHDSDRARKLMTQGDRGASMRVTTGNSSAAFAFTRGVALSAKLRRGGERFARGGIRSSNWKQERAQGKVDQAKGRVKQALDTPTRSDELKSEVKSAKAAAKPATRSRGRIKR